MKRRWAARVIAMGIAGAAASLYQFGCLAGLRSFNPCGTVLSENFCTPQQFERLFGNFFTPNFDVDATCTIPFNCGNFPEEQGGGGG